MSDTFMYVSIMFFALSGVVAWSCLILIAGLSLLTFSQRKTIIKDGSEFKL